MLRHCAILFFSTLTAAFASSACSSHVVCEGAECDARPADEGDRSAGAGAASTGDSAAGSGAEGGTPVASSGQGAEDSSGVGATSGTAGSGAGGTGPCGGYTCAADEYCADPVFECGPGTYFEDQCCDTDDICAVHYGASCLPRPTSCSAGGPKVCGCDGTIYDNECAANAAGVGASATATGCAPPEGSLPCGPYYCNGATEYCRWDCADFCSDYCEMKCVPYPSECATAPDCDCLDSVCYGGTCTQDSDGATLHCSDAW